MRFERSLSWMWFLLLLAIGGVAQSQVVPAGKSGPGSNLLSAGVGASYWDPDWGSGRMIGITAWADVHLRRDLGIEIEGRDVRFNRQAGQQNLIQDTIGGGPIYTYSRFPKLRPYAKFLVDYCSFDFPNSSNPTFTHDTRTAYVPGGGLEYDPVKNVAVRLDYEFQLWQSMFGNPTPQGFTLGLSYDFPRFGRRPGAR